MSELLNLITRLEKGIVKNASYIKTIRNPYLLLTSLKELYELIGNDKVKDSVATQVSHLIMMRRRANEKTNMKEDEVMLNAVLYGPPGVGKTLIGTKLAKIWFSLGYLDGSRNPKERKGELGETLKEVFGASGMAGGTDTDDNLLYFYIMFMFIIILVSIMSMIWSFYSRFGGYMTIIAITILLFLILFVGYFISSSLSTETNSSIKSKPKNINQNNTDISITDLPEKNDLDPEKSVAENVLPVIDMPSDDEVIKVVTRADFVDKYVGWTSIKTNKLLENNLGKVLFVDEAYSLINGPHDEFGMEALTALNLFLSQRPKEIIVIFAGYKDLLEAGPYSVQPGLKRRFMWQFDCSGYTPDQLFAIFKLQLKRKGWGLTDEKATQDIFTTEYDAFPAFGGDTERAGFFAELEHSREYIANESNLGINMLTPYHVKKGIEKLRENNLQDDGGESTNPMANIMKMLKSGKKDDNMNILDMIGKKSFM